MNIANCENCVLFLVGFIKAITHVVE
jgi:hypothetical protein